MPDAILDLAYEVSRVTEEKIALIEGIMRRTGILALNARLEAARVGTSGSAFSVVAQEMSAVAGDIQMIANDLRQSVSANMERLRHVGSKMHLDARGERLADLAYNAIEIVDRSLYERSCDVRWWATGNSAIRALERGDPESAAYASRRLVGILRSYTVYLDLWIADRDGRVIATGRPDVYRSALEGDVSRDEWFARGLATTSTEEFVVCNIARHPLLDGKAAAAFSTAVRRGEGRHAEPLGVLGIFFDWEPQASAIVNNAALSHDDRSATRVMILDADYRVIASSEGVGLFEEIYPLATGGRDRGWYRSGDSIVAFARNPGFETYRGLGWFGCIEVPVASQWVSKEIERRGW